MINTAKYWGKIIVALLLVLMVAYGAYYVYDLYFSHERAKLVSQETLKRADLLAKDLHISKINADQLQKELANEKGKPASVFYVQSPTVTAGAAQVQSRINSNDLTLPLMVLKPSDRTIVTANIDRQVVEVRKINLAPAWEISIGAGVDNGVGYVPIGIQRNFSRYSAVRVEPHVQFNGGVRVSGGSVQMVWLIK